MFRRGRHPPPGVPVLPHRHRVRRLAADAAGDDRQAESASAVTAEVEFLTAATQAMAGASTGAAALDALGWWDVLPHLADPDARIAAFVVFRTQGRTLASSPALGALMAQPYV